MSHIARSLQQIPLFGTRLCFFFRNPDAISKTRRNAPHWADFITKHM